MRLRPIPLARVRTRWPISLNRGASCAWTAMNPSAMTLPSSSAVLGRSLKLALFSVLTVLFPVDRTELVQGAEDLRPATGTTTSSNVLYCLTVNLLRRRRCLDAERDHCQCKPAHLLLFLKTAIHRPASTVDFDPVFRINATLNKN
jgi:hypothetical protein